MEESLKEYGKLEGTIKIKLSERKMLKNKKDEQFQALREELTGQLPFSRILGTVLCSNHKIGM